MALHGQCSACGTTAWLNEDGSCAGGHARQCVHQVVDTDDVVTTSSIADTAKRAGRWITDLKKPKTPEEAEAREARDEYEGRVKAAKDALAMASAPLDTELAAARASLATANAHGTRAIASLCGLALYENILMTPSGGIDLESEPVELVVDAAGTLYTAQQGGLGRAAVGGILFGPAGAVVGAATRKSKTVDSRELYIIVTSPRVSSTVRCDPDKGMQARQFAAQVHMTAAGAADRARQRAELVPQWIRHVDDLVIRRAAALAPFRQAVAAAEADTARVDAAQAALPARS